MAEVEDAQSKEEALPTGRTRLAQLLDRKGDLGSQLIVVSVSFFLTTVLAGVVGFFVKRHEQSTAIRNERVEDVRKFANALFARITLAEMVKSSLKRNSTSEIAERKRDYDKAFATWNGDIMSAYLLMRKLSANDSKNQRLVDCFEKALVPRLEIMDRDITHGVDGKKLPAHCPSYPFGTTKTEARKCGVALVNLLTQMAEHYGDSIPADENQFKSLEEECDTNPAPKRSPFKCGDQLRAALEKCHDSGDGEVGSGSGLATGGQPP